MHTLASKVSVRNRELVPRYYYKLAEKTSCSTKIRNFFRLFLTFLFTQVGVIVLIAAYMVCGAAIFQNIEADSLMDMAQEAHKTRCNYTLHIWSLTARYNVLRPDLWREEVEEVIMQFQDSVVMQVRRGYTGNDPGVRVWTFSSSLMYSLTVFTTIGYGNLTPQTSLGKVVTIMYALVGIPLMFIYMANIGTILATSFKYSYSKLCRCERPADLPKQATLPSLRSDTLSCLEEETPSTGSLSSHGKISLEESALGWPNMPKKVNSSTLKSIINSNIKNVEERVTHQKIDSKPVINNIESRPKHSVLERLTSKSSGKSVNSEKEETVKFELVEDFNLITIPITTCLMVLISYIICGAAIFSAWEGWTFLDGFYFCFISLMTIGFGDFVPGNSYIYAVAENMSEQEANAKLVLGSVYLLLGMGVIAMCVNLAQEKIFIQVRQLARFLGLIREFRHEIDD